jgi:hypothetical protein
MAISLVFLCAFAAVMLYVAITITLRLERDTKTYVFTNAVKKFDEIMEIAQVLPELEGKERRAACRTIAKNMRWHSIFLQTVVRDAYRKCPEERAEVKELMVAVIRECLEMNLLLGRFLFALRFRRVKNCHRRLKQAMQRHFELWELFDRLMQAQHREQYKNLP